MAHERFSFCSSTACNLGVNTGAKAVLSRDGFHDNELVRNYAHVCFVCLLVSFFFSISSYVFALGYNMEAIERFFYFPNL